AVKNNRAALLERMNQYVEAARLPSQEQAAALAELRETTARQPILVREFEPAVEKIAQAVKRTQGLLRCAATGLAVERYRRKYGRWPDNLDQLTGDFLRAVPRDPFDGRPLRYR